MHERRVRSARAALARRRERVVVQVVDAQCGWREMWIAEELADWFELRDEQEDLVVRVGGPVGEELLNATDFLFPGCIGVEARACYHYGE